MNHRSPKIPAILVVISAALLLSGTRACQEDYDLASQSTVPTAEPTDDTVSPVGSRTPTDTPEPSETPTVIPTKTATSDGTTTPTVAPTETDLAQVSALLRDLGDLSATGSSISSTPVVPPKSISSGGTEGRTYSENWLGKIYRNQNTIDSDGDGYSDALESDFESDPLDRNSQPPPPVTLLDKRLGQRDADLDGLTIQTETELNLDPGRSDTDGDGISDGAEVLSQSDPRNRRSKPQPDNDKDGLSDEVEAKYHTNPHSADTDGDGASDAEEIAVGSNPNSPDSDEDGILDGKELELGSDPVVAERQR